MKNDKNAKIVIFVILAFVFVLCFSVIGVNYSKDDYSLSIVEKKWVTDNINNVIDVSIYNDIPVYGYNGDGVSFDFLSKFSEEYNIKFNKVSYYSNDLPKYSNIAFKVLTNDDKVTSKDILFYQDDYVVLSKDSDIVSNVFNIRDKVGVLSSDKDLISDYFKGYDNILYYDNFDLMVDNINRGDIKYIIVPNMKFMNKILSNELNIVYHISDLDMKYVLSVSDDNVYNILYKFYLKYKKSYFKDTYSKSFLSMYFNSTNTLAVNQKNYNGKIYKYGFAVNMPYENFIDGNFVGTVSRYLKGFEDVSNTEIEVIRYDSVDDVKNALVNEEIDFAFGNFDYSNINVKNIATSSFSSLDYVVLSKKNINVNSIKGLRNYSVMVVGSSNLYSLLTDNDIDAVVYNNTDDLLRNIDDNSICIMDKYLYYYYSKVKFSDFKVVYDDYIRDGYKFIVNSKYATFANLLDYYISSNDYNNIRYSYRTNVGSYDGNPKIWLVILLILCIICFVFIALYINKKRDKNDILKDDLLKFIDPMTSLKNRNYLNHNIYKWDDNVIFPQSVIVFDVNNLREINDRLGREAGDELIKKIASVLIDNQLENSDIVRSGGDEFLIYMIGYDEKKTLDYAKKLSKLMANISHSDGVEFGYSMIFDEVKTVDDAINESINMLDKNKDEFRG